MSRGGLVLVDRAPARAFLLTAQAPPGARAAGAAASARECAFPVDVLALEEWRTQRTRVLQGQRAHWLGPFTDRHTGEAVRVRPAVCGFALCACAAEWKPAGGRAALPAALEAARAVHCVERPE